MAKLVIKVSQLLYTQQGFTLCTYIHTHLYLSDEMHACTQIHCRKFIFLG